MKGYAFGIGEFIGIGGGELCDPVGAGCEGGGFHGFTLLFSRYLYRL